MSENPISPRRAQLVLLGAGVAVFFTAFEIRQPIVSLGAVGFTSSELAAGFFFLTVAIWAAADRTAFFSRRALDIPVILFVAANFLSLAVAEDKPGALKFALRMTYAALIYFGISRLPARTRSHLWIAGAITVTMLAVTIVGLLEAFLPAVYWPYWLSPWQEGSFTFGTFYNVRVASTLPFPTVLSMYLELTIPLALVLGIWLAVGGKGGTKTKWLLTALFVGVGAGLIVMIFTFTRTALLVMSTAFLAGAGAALIWGYGRRTAGWLALGAAALPILLAGLSLYDGKVATRLGLAPQTERYSAEYTIVDFPAAVKPGGEYSATIHVKNTSNVVWKPEGRDRVLMCYQWLNYEDWEERQARYITTELPGVVEPGGEIDLEMAFAAPAEPGRYVLFVDLAKEGVGWFSTAHIPPMMVPLEMSATGSSRLPLPEYGENFVEGGEVSVQPSRSTLWKAAAGIWKDNPLLGVGPGQFRKVYPAYVPGVRADERLETHNIFLAALANTGIVGFAVMLFLLASAAGTQIKMVRDKALAWDRRFIALGLLIAMIAYLVHGFMDYFLWQTGIAFLFFVQLGLTAWLDNQHRTKKI